VCSPNISSRESCPDRIVPDFGKVTEHSVESQPKVPCNVLKEAPSGSYLANKPFNLRPQVPRVRFTRPLARNAERLAGIAANEANHLTAPRPAIKGSNIRPDRRFIQPTLLHLVNQVRAAERFSLHVTDAASLRHSDSKSEVESSDARA